MEVVFISGIFMSFFIVLLLLTKKNKTLPDKILTIWMAVIGLHLLGFYYSQAGYWGKYPHLIGTTAPIPLFHGPLLYLYSLYALRSKNRFHLPDLLHFVPGIAAYFYMSRFFFFYSPEKKILIDKGEINDFSTFSYVLLVSILLSGIIYSILSYRLTIRYKKTIKERFSYSEGISLQWLRYCIVSMALIFLSAITVFGLRDGLSVAFPFNPEYIFYIILILLIFYIGYFGIKHENIFIDSTVVENRKKATEEKYKNSGVKDEEAAKIYEKLLQFMQEEKPFLKPKLSLSELAENLYLSTNQLSQIINQQAGENFYDFVNKYRVEEFLQKAEKNKNLSLLALALDAGFNSKSSFNYIFKRQKRLSPSQYLAEIAKKQE